MTTPDGDNFVREDSAARAAGALSASFTGSAAAASVMPFYALPFFITPLQKEFGWNRGAIGMAATFCAFGLFLFSPIVGRLCDRFGVRKVVIPSTVLYAATVAGLSQVHGSIWTLYVGYGLISLFGAGATPVTYSRIVSGWFDKRRGLALGFMMCGSGMMVGITPLVMNPVIATYGWRAGFLVVAGVGLAQAPIALVLLHERRAPSKMKGAAFRSSTIWTQGAGATLAQALTTRAFWLMATAVFLQSIAISGILIQFAPMLVGGGMTKAAAARAIALTGVGAVFGRLGSGLLIDRLHGPWVAGGMFALSAASFALLKEGTGLAGLAAFLMGVTLGAEHDLLAYLTTRYFGMRSMAEIYGWLFGAICLGAAIGPMVVGFVLDMNGNYSVALNFSMAAAVAAAVLVGCLPRYPDTGFTAPAGVELHSA